MTKSKIAVFIDSENINSNDYTYINNKIITEGTIVVYNIYGDWFDQNSSKWVDISKKYGINKIQVDKIAGKESVDHKICVDMMDYLHTKQYIDIFYLITSDSDYRHVIHKIKEYNKKVYCIGNNLLTSCLVPVCNKYTKISDLKQLNKSVNFNIIKSNIKELSCLKTINQDNIDIYWDSIKKFMIPNKVYNLSYINDTLKRLYPRFNHKLYKTESFRDFMQKYYGDFIELSYTDNKTVLIKLK